MVNPKHGNKGQGGKRGMWIALAALVSAVLVAAIGWFLWDQNNGLSVSRYSYESHLVPSQFDGFCIVQVSDLHNKAFGKEQERLLRLIDAEQPDLVVITGDLVDNSAMENALCFAKQAAGMATCCYVPGNHEARSPSYAKLRQELQEAGVQLLENSAISLERQGERIWVLGVLDPAFSPWEEGLLDRLASEGEGELRILLSHRPDRLEAYASSGVELVFSGHAHGGQIRLPGIGGLFAPDQGLFPKYTSGMRQEGGTTLVISRGLGNSAFPLRLFNRPELVVFRLQSA